MTTHPLTPSQPDSLRAILTDTFEGVALTCVELQGRPCFIAREIGDALGYSQRGKRFADKVTGAWAPEMEEGRDYQVLAGDDLAALKAVLPLGTTSVPSRSPSVMVLYERGLHLALLKTNKAAGRRLRTWLAERAMPALARGKAIDAHGQVLEGTHGRPALDTDDLRQRRLTLAEGRRTLERLEREGVLEPKQAGRALLQTFKATMRGVLSDELLDSLGAPAAPERSQLPARVPPNAVMLPAEAAVVDRSWLSPMQIAARLEMPGTKRELQARVGRAISSIGELAYDGDKNGLRNDRAMARPVVVNKQGAGDTLQVDGETGEPATTFGHLYHPQRVPPIVEAWLRRNRPEWLQAST